MIPKPLASISEADLDSLVTNKVDERKTLEFKRTLPREDDKTEFRADVTSLANSSGGDLIYGVDAVEGVATAVLGLGDAKVDPEILRLQSLLLTHVDPRIPGVEMQAVPVGAKGHVLVVRVPKSWRGPHLVRMVKDEKAFRMFGRHSKGKWDFDGTEIRSAYLLSEQLEHRMRRWRDDRLAKVATREMPVALEGGPLVALHMMPLSAFNEPNAIPAADLEKHRPAPIFAGGWNHHINLDGFVLYSGASGAIGASKVDSSYTQFFRSGCVEAVSTMLFDQRGSHLVLAGLGYERELVTRVAEYTNTLVKVGVTHPIIVTMAILGARGSVLLPASGFFDGRPLDRDAVVLPEVLFERPDQDVKTTMRPLFDAVWNAYGYPRSFNYDEKGQWQERR